MTKKRRRHRSRKKSSGSRGMRVDIKKALPVLFTDGRATPLVGRVVIGKVDKIGEQT